MKKVLKVLLMAILAVCLCLPVVACDGANSASSTPGLKVKKNKDGVYVIYDYVQEEGVTELNIGEKLNSGVTDVVLQKGAFEGNSKLTKIIVSDKVSEIQAGAFQKMSALVTVELPFIGKTANSDAYLGESKKDDHKSVDSERTIAHLFGTEEYDAGIPITVSYNSASSTTCYMPETFKEVIVNASEEYSIPMYAFSGAVNLTKVELKGKIVAIGESAFSGLRITSITLPTSLKTIYTGAFMNCEKLATLVVSGVSLTEVKANAFLNTNLSKGALDSAIALTTDQKTEIFGE